VPHPLSNKHCQTVDVVQGTSFVGLCIRQCGQSQCLHGVRGFKDEGTDFDTAIDTSGTRKEEGKRDRAPMHVSWTGRIPTKIGT
jgi:hypothetical protein